MTPGHCAVTNLGYPVGQLRGKIGPGHWVGQRFDKEMRSTSSVGRLHESSRLWLLAGSDAAFEV